MFRTHLAGLPCLAMLAFYLAGCSESDEPILDDATHFESPTFVGSLACQSCHASEFDSWMGSHHQRAMQIADATTVLGDFENVTFDYFGATTRFSTRGKDYIVETADQNGATREFRVAFTFGVEPLQQYLVEFPGGRLQALPFSWDSHSAEEGGQRWFHLYSDENILPGDELHWTGQQHNWNYMCAECHSTDFKMQFDAPSNSFASTYSEISVGCEACHGPGSLHVQQAQQGKWSHSFGLQVDLDDRKGAVWVINDETGIAERSELLMHATTQVEACGRCHARRAVVAPDYVYGRPLLDTHLPSLLEENLYFADGQIQDEVYVYGSFLQSKMYRAGVTCSDCHNPHNAALLSESKPSDICSQCHLTTRFNTSEHHGHAVGQVECVDCHMPNRTYMAVDDRRDHSFRIPRPDLTVSIGTPNACTHCHDDRDAIWAAAAVVDWHGKVVAERPEYATAIAAARYGDANIDLIEVFTETAFPGIARATALTLLAPPFSETDIRNVQEGLANPDPIIRIAALRALRSLPPERQLRNGAADSLSDPVKGVRVEAASVLAGLQELMSADEAAAFESAAVEYRTAFTAILNRPEAHANLGGFELALGNVGKATAYYEQALDLAPLMTSARVNLADLLRGVDEQRSEALLRDGIELDPESGAIRHSLGLLLVRTGQQDDGLEQLKGATDFSPDNSRFAYVYAIALNSTDQPSAALRAMEEANRRFPANFDISWALATMYLSRGESGKAEQIAKNLANRYPDNERVSALLDSIM